MNEKDLDRGRAEALKVVTAGLSVVAQVLRAMGGATNRAAGAVEAAADKLEEDEPVPPTPTEPPPTGPTGPPVNP